MPVRTAYRPLCWVLPAAALLSACAGREQTQVATAPPPPPVAAAPAFTGYGNLQVPPRLPDGSFATPNSNLSAAATVWHLRAGLNVAALGCRGADEAALIAGYNALLARHRDEFAAAYRTLSQEYRNVAGFDAAMTRLYNYYALPPAQAGLCDAARAVLSEGAMLSPGTLAQFATTALGQLNAPFVAVYTRQEAWLARRSASSAPVTIAAALPARPAPHITVDLTALR